MKKIRLSTPGEIMLEELIKPLGLTQYRVAKDCRIPHPTLNRIIKNGGSISIENAMRLGRYFGNSSEFWINLQKDYDLRMAKDKLKVIEREVQPLKRAA